MICRKSAPSLSYLPVFLAMSEQIYSDMMHFSGSQSEGNQKMVERRSVTQKHTSGEAQGVFGVHYYLLAGYARSRRNYVAVAVGAEPAARVVAAPVRARSLHTAGARLASRCERLPQANRADRCCP